MAHRADRTQGRHGVAPTAVGRRRAALGHEEWSYAPRSHPNRSAVTASTLMSGRSPRSRARKGAVFNPAVAEGFAPRTAYRSGSPFRPLQATSSPPPRGARPDLTCLSDQGLGSGRRTSTCWSPRATRCRQSAIAHSAHVGRDQTELVAGHPRGVTPTARVDAPPTTWAGCQTRRDPDGDHHLPRCVATSGRGARYSGDGGVTDLEAQAEQRRQNTLTAFSLHEAHCQSVIGECTACSASVASLIALATAHVYRRAGVGAWVHPEVRRGASAGCEGGGSP